MFPVQCEESKINHLTLLLVMTVLYACWFLWRANYIKDFKWRLHFQFGIAFWRVLFWERCIFWRAKSCLKGIEDFDLQHWYQPTKYPFIPDNPSITHPKSIHHYLSRHPIFSAMIGSAVNRSVNIRSVNRQLVTDEAVEFENNRLKFKSAGKLPIILEEFIEYTPI